jgi:hypothetical protein
MVNDKWKMNNGESVYRVQTHGNSQGETQCAR